MNKRSKVPEGANINKVGGKFKLQPLPPSLPPSFPPSLLTHIPPA